MTPPTYYSREATNALDNVDGCNTFDGAKIQIARAQVYALLQIVETLDYHLSNITGTLKGEK